MIQLIYAISYIPDHWVLIFKWVLFLLFRSGFVESAITQCLCFFYLLLIIIIVTYLLILQLHESAIFYQKCFSHPLLSIYTPFLPLSSWNYKTIPEWCKMAYCPLSDVKWLYHALRDTSSSHNISTQKVNLGQFLTQLKADSRLKLVFGTRTFHIWNTLNYFVLIKEEKECKWIKREWKKHFPIFCWFFL